MRSSTPGPLAEALRLSGAVWSGRDGPLKVDRSSQEPGARNGTHAAMIGLRHFPSFQPRGRFPAHVREVDP